MFVQPGLGKVNPFMTAELPRVRDLGSGSYLAGMVRMAELCAENGWTEAWSATGGYKRYPGLFCFDRFRTDVDWPAQLEATAQFLERLAPALRGCGVRLNLETHEEITTFEIVRLIERIGDDVLGICLDPANVMVRGELVSDAVARSAPWTHMTQLRDAVLVPTQSAISRFLMPIGQGVIDWYHLLGQLFAVTPDLDLVVEGVGATRAEMPLCPDDPLWLASHPDITERDIEGLRALARNYPAQTVRGEMPSIEELRRRRPQATALSQFLTSSQKHLRSVLALHSARLAPVTTER
jgi:sugar phosphate isomerase/epimerase